MNKNLKSFGSRAAVFGGKGNMGKLTVKLFQNLNYKVFSVDPKNPNSLSASEAIKQAQVIFFSVSPIDQIEKIISKNLVLFKNKLVLDNATVKQPLSKIYKVLDARGVSICSVNPLCKHDQPLAGQKVIILGFGKNTQKAKILAESLYKNAGMITVPFSFEDHDHMMLFVQFIPHLVMRAVGRVFEKNNVDMNLIEKIASANFQLFSLSLWRTIIQEPNISSTIIHSSIKQTKGKKLAKEIKLAIEEVSKQMEEEKLAGLLKRSFAKLNRANIGKRMNKITTSMLEHLVK